MTLRFRNLVTTPDAPPSEWGFEGLLAAIERGSIKDWERVAAEIRMHPHGSVARLLDEEVIDAISSPGERELFRHILKRARDQWDHDARDEVARRLRDSLQRSGLSQRQFATRLGTSPSRFSTYLTGKVIPGADLLVRAERVASASAVESSPHVASGL